MLTKTVPTWALLGCPGSSVCGCAVVVPEPCANAKSSTHKVMAGLRKHRVSKQTWATFLRNHASETQACGFAQAYDLFFRTVPVFVVVEPRSR